MRQHSLALFIFCVCGHWTNDLVSSEMFTAMADMEALLYAEKEVVNVIHQYIEAENQRLQKLKAFAKDYLQRTQAAARDGSSYLNNPLNTFLTVKRLTNDWMHVESLMKSSAAETFIQNITQHRAMSSFKFPTTEDLQGTAIALMRIQDTYQIDTSTMASGKINGLPEAEELTANDCYEVARVAYNENDHYHTVQWMQEALNRVRKEDPPTASEPEILEYLAFSLYQQGNVEHALHLTRTLLEIAPDHPRAPGNERFYADTMEKQGKVDVPEEKMPTIRNPRADDGAVAERDTYEALCRGEDFTPPSNKSKLFCFYKSDRPYLTIAPIKAEVVHLKPKIIVFRGVVYDSEIEVIKRLARPRLARATVQNSVTGENEPATYRISKSAWLKAEDDDVVDRLNKRMEDMTDLNMETAEETQIANYGLGGHYDPHFDFARKEETNAFKGLNSGNRVATVLFYLSQPTAGGATVFPDLRLTLFPTVNDAAFWHNMFKNGEGDMTTRHAACPVLAGDKWVSNKWLHEYGQEFMRSCDLDEWAYE